MEKILTIDGRPVNFKSTGAFLLRYKAQFHRDALKDIYRMKDFVDETVDEETGKKVYVLKDIEVLDLEIFYNLVWTLAKTADPQIPPPLEWLDTFEEFPLFEILPELMDMMFASMESSVQSKKKLKNQGGKGKKISN